MRKSEKEDLCENLERTLPFTGLGRENSFLIETNIDPSSTKMTGLKANRLRQIWEYEEAYRKHIPECGACLLVYFSFLDKNRNPGEPLTHTDRTYLNLLDR